MHLAALQLNYISFAAERITLSTMLFRISLAVIRMLHTRGVQTLFNEGQMQKNRLTSGEYNYILHGWRKERAMGGDRG